MTEFFEFPADWRDRCLAFAQNDQGHELIDYIGSLSVSSPEGGEPTPTRDRIALLRRAAEGRREYAAALPENETNPALREQRAALLAQSSALESAAKIMEGDDGPLYGLLPSWRWTDEQVRALDDPVSPSPNLGAGDSPTPRASLPTGDQVRGAAQWALGFYNPAHEYAEGDFRADADRVLGADLHAQIKALFAPSVGGDSTDTGAEDMVWMMVIAETGELSCGPFETREEANNALGFEDDDRYDVRQVSRAEVARMVAAAECATRPSGVGEVATP